MVGAVSEAYTQIFSSIEPKNILLKTGVHHLVFLNGESSAGHLFGLCASTKGGCNLIGYTLMCFRENLRWEEGFSQIWGGILENSMGNLENDKYWQTMNSDAMLRLGELTKGDPLQLVEGVAPDLSQAKAMAKQEKGPTRPFASTSLGSAAQNLSQREPSESSQGERIRDLEQTLTQVMAMIELTQTQVAEMKQMMPTKDDMPEPKAEQAMAMIELTQTQVAEMKEMMPNKAEMSESKATQDLLSKKLEEMSSMLQDLNEQKKGWKDLVELKEAFQRLVPQVSAITDEMTALKKKIGLRTMP